MSGSLWGTLMSLRRVRWLPAAAGMAILAAMGVYVPSLGQTSNAARIEVKGFAFVPTPLTVKAGSTVTWVNRDDEPHTVVSDTGMFKSGGMDTNETFSYKFDRPGTYRFACSIHPRMVGTIVVE
ncbi:MAG TPA: cupredoxin family copper-binding protein [Steroidobacteraceae bacterium]|nr:cupredoxin family copper-binding protein [Steroidobacteraceae bacterium]